MIISFCARERQTAAAGRRRNHSTFLRRVVSRFSCFESNTLAGEPLNEATSATLTSDFPLWSGSQPPVSLAQRLETGSKASVARFQGDKSVSCLSTVRRLNTLASKKQRSTNKDSTLSVTKVVDFTKYPIIPSIGTKLSQQLRH